MQENCDVQVSASLTRNDVYQFNVQLNERPRPWRVRLLNELVLFGFVLLIEVWQRWPVAISEWWSILIHAMLMMVGMKIIGHIIFVPAFAACLSYAARTRGALGDHLFCLTQEGLVEHNAMGRRMTYWANVRSVEDLLDYVGIEIEKTIFVVVPKAAFKSPGEAQEFIEKVRRRVSDASSVNGAR